jgi:HAD superfamily hydrolase (TIGR01509 family)
MKLPGSIKAFFFDLDGTLIDTIPVLYETYIDFLAGFGKAGSKEEFHEFNGPSLKEIITLMKQRYELPGSETELLKLYDSELATHYAGIRCGADVLELLSTLRLQGYKLYLVTSAAENLVSAMMRENQLASSFDGFTFGDEVRLSKPDPEIYEQSLAKFHLTPADVAVVEDSCNGIRSAKSAGLYVIALAGTHEASELQSSGADKVISTLPELIEMV